MPLFSDKFITQEELAKFASDAASALRRGGRVSPAYAAARAEKELGVIKTAMREASSYAERHVSIPQELEWLLDNWYIADREGKCAVSDLKSSPRLPGVWSEPKRLLVVEAARALAESGLCAVTAERVVLFLDAFQEVLCLSEAELASFIPALRLELVSKLAEACFRLKPVMEDGVPGDGLAELFGRIFTSLRFLAGFDASEILESVNRVERTLRRDPSGVYPAMDESTRLSYRREIARLAEKSRSGESETAEEVLRLAEENSCHVGFYLFTKPLGIEKKPLSGSFYIGLILLSSLFFALLASFELDRPALALLLLLPISEFVKNVADYVILRAVPPKRIPRLELKDGAPEEGKTLCVISVLLSSKESGSHACGLLEEYALANRDAGNNLKFGILADLPDAKSAQLPGDEAWLSAAEEAINRLNNQYGGGFFLFCRSRRFHERDRRYSPWERKRGAILELCRFLRRADTQLVCRAGDAGALESTRFLITLDSDTRLCAGAAKELIGAALHPLNRPVLDAERGIVVSGSGILQPRISVDLTSANQSDYTKIFAGQGGIDPYGGITGDFYQNLFGTGSFAGKGLIDIDAYLCCLEGRFPENLILSHDLLEGAYLRCSYAGDIELTDGYPAKVTTYYDRMHRWIRGDWQSLPWLFGTVRTASARGKNVLGQLDRWKIADNLRRSLVPIFTFLSLAAGMLLDDRDFLWAALAALLAAVSHLVIASATDVFTRKRGRVRYHSTVVSGVAGQVLQTAVRLLLLPYEAWVSFSAIVTSLYRMLVSHRNLLVWVTAADSERRAKNSFVQILSRMWPSLAGCLLILLFSPFPAASAVALIWCLSPFAVAALGDTRQPRTVLNAEDKRLLLRCAGDIWHFFEDFMTAEDHFLPPDNFQEQPAAGVAHRTSPTNIGLALLSCLAACDLGVCQKDAALQMIERIFSSIKDLPKWNGHLYNWYDTLTLAVLQPAYISSVDSGNFAGCLVALREGLQEMGETGLAQEADALFRGMSFTQLFDPKRQLFYIGWDIGKNEPTEGWYDLLASEAMQTSYIAIARGDVPRKHWRRLGRALVAKDGYRGMASWTGTMFEYLMPELLLPCYRNSLVYESLKFCVYVQKKRAKGFPWGMSESAFYAFDHTLSYRYKAHGVQRLALKRGMGREAVISPYSTFLALLIEPRAAVTNIRRLQKLGMEGRYGLYEAADFTPSRIKNRKFEIVRTYMAHHLGMSLVALDNALRSGVMQRRFMRDREMAAYAELLQEKVPVGGLLLRQPPRDVPEKPARASSSCWHFETEDINCRTPACTILGNGAYTVVIDETGRSSSAWNGVTLTKTSFEPLGTDAGISFYLRCGDELMPLAPSPVFDRSVRYAADLSGEHCRIIAHSGSIRTSVTAGVPESESGEMRTVEIVSSVRREGELVCYLEPVLSRLADYASHPAFSKLSLETQLLDGAVVIHRRPRARGRGLAMAVSASLPFGFDTSRELALGRGGFFALKKALMKAPGGTAGAVLDPCLIFRVPLTLEKGEPERVTFAFTIAATPPSAAEAAKRLLSDRESAFTSRLDEASRRLRLPPELFERAMALLPDLVLPSPERRISADRLAALSLGQRGLWTVGISGDLPIIASVVADRASLEHVPGLIAVHRLLTENGVPFDLVFLLKDSGDYRSPLQCGILDCLRKQNIEYRLSARGGIHTVDLSAPCAPLIQAAAVRCVQSAEELGRGALVAEVPETREFLCPCPEEPLHYFYNDDNSFTFVVNGRLPENAWSHVLANERFGYLATDAGTGHLWYLNARENKINRWENDSLAVLGTERLLLHAGGRQYSLFASEDGCPCDVTYGFGWARWRKTAGGLTVTTTAFVPPGLSARVFIVEADARELEITYYTDLVLSPDPSGAVYVETAEENGVLSAQNAYNTEFAGAVFRLVPSSPAEKFTCSKYDYLSGRFDGASGAGFMPCFAAVYRTSGTLVLVSGCEEAETLKNLAVPAAASAKLDETKAYWSALTSILTVRTPDDNLNRYLNGWALYQTLACRIFGRTSLYQSGGAYGFRDQLQDVCAVIGEVPNVTRAHLMRAGAHQFEEGDVQHWWHPARNSEIGSVPDKGVRTRCSDDLLWLPYALCQYVEETGDRSVLGEAVPYLSSTPLSEDETERYEEPKLSALRETLLQHAVRAAELVIRRGTGRHGLCFIGSGDWNDGMNLVGARGDGESVWLTWFAAVTLDKLSRLCLTENNPGAASRFSDAAEAYKTAAENAWDGDWFIRGYYDDGAPLGSCVSDECRIDSIAQSFAALAGADSLKVRTALESAVERLFDREDRVVRLFDPPFSTGSAMPGYIKGYSPGFRENGGQYTHGAVWLAMGLLRAGMKTEGWEVLKALLPQDRPNEIYRTEPYVLAADVYSGEGHVGRGGWTWYTGAAGWYRRTALEELLGLRLRGGVLNVQPALPPGWEGFEAVWRHGGKEYLIQVTENGAEVTVDGSPADDSAVFVAGPDAPGS